MQEMSKVYFTDLKAWPGMSLLDKLKILVKKAGIENIDFENKFVAIKIHFGEPGNLSFLRPNYSRVIVDLVRELGGKPFLTDCNTLYVGGRKNAVDHLEAAFMNGYNPLTTNCPIIIADGLRGSDETAIEVDGDYVKSAKIGSAVADADIIISMNHFKGHEATGFGGAIKNLGMGCGSRAGKMEMHSAGKPVAIPEKCVGCKKCFSQCAHGAISYDDNGKVVIDHSKCVGCARCMGICNFHAIKSPNDESNDILNMKIVEYTAAVIKDKPNFHINFIMDISPNCDCHSENDRPIAPSIGIAASFDPVALDKASADLVNKEMAFENSLVGENLKVGIDLHDHFHNAHPNTNWTSMIEHGKKMGLGTDEYELVKI